jgi:LCP family protein required for cell wall assembly
VKKAVPVKPIILSCIIVALVATGLIIMNRLEKNGYAEKRENMSEGFGQLRTVTVNGVQYREKPAVVTLLLAGIDKTMTEENQLEENYRSGGQADFLMLIAFDHTDKKIHRLQIDRDTMSEIDILGIFGNEVGTRTEQICLSHSFGDKPETNAKYTLKAVERLLDGLKIDSYYMIDYSAVGAINDTLGGVTVTVPCDMTSVNKEWTEGRQLELHGNEAETFVRTRMTVGDGTNKERMIRQNEYANNAIKAIKARSKNNKTLIEKVLNCAKGSSISNISVKQLANEIYRSQDYTVLETSYLNGEYKTGQDGFVEFWADEDAAAQWVLEHLYARCK